MRKPVVIACLLLAAVMLANRAQALQKGGGGKSGGRSGGSKDSNKGLKTADSSNAEIDDLTSKLTLTDPQKAQVKSVFDARDAQLTALKKEKLPKDESKGKSKEIKDAANQRIWTLLTLDQQKIFDGTMKKGVRKNKDEAPEATPSAEAGPATP